jgi:hypothetical protein
MLLNFFFNIRYLLKAFLVKIIGFMGVELSNIIIDITYHEFIVLKLSVFEKKKLDKVC